MPLITQPGTLRYRNEARFVPRATRATVIVGLPRTRRMLAGERSMLSRNLPPGVGHPVGSATQPATRNVPSALAGVGVAAVLERWPVAAREKFRRTAEAHLEDKRLSRALLRAVILLTSLPAPRDGSRAQEIRAAAHGKLVASALLQAAMVLASLPLDGSYLREPELYWRLGLSQDAVRRLVKTLLVLGLIEREDPGSNCYKLAR